MPKLSLSLPAKLTASVVSDHEDVVMDTAKTRMFLGAYLPGSEVLEEAPREPDILVEHKQSTDNRLYQMGTNAVLYEQWDEEMPFDVYHLLYSAERSKLIERGVFPVHSACLQDENGDYVLLVGHSGAGKSTTALEMVSKSGMKMASGNKTIIQFDEQNNMRPIAGTATMTIRSSDRERFNGLIGEELEYYNRLAFKLAEEYAAQAFCGRVRAIIAVRLQDGPRIVDPPESPVSAFHQLYHFFLDVLCTHATVSQCEGSFVTTDSRGQIERLSTKLKASLSDVPFIKMFGPLDFIRGNIETLISNNYGKA